MTPRSGYFAGEGRLPLFEQSWLPTEQPRAAVVLIHGLIEHSGQHTRTALELVRQGYSVHAMDLRGHGRSEGPRCDVGTFDQYLLDLDIFFQRVQADVGDRPLFLMGNSMGGLIATLWSILRQPRINGLILSGPLLAPASDLYPWLRRFARFAAALVPGLRVTRTPFDWLASDPNVVARFRDDPLVFHGCFTVRVGAEILRAMKLVSEQAEALPRILPLLILQGSKDRICDPSGSQHLYAKAGCADKTYHLYEGFYHEVFDDPQRERVLADLTTWLHQHAPSKHAPSIHALSTDLTACKNRLEI